jgi:hypothetical protein
MLPPPDAEFLERAKQLGEEMYHHYKKISHEETPRYDGSGRKIVDKRPDGFDYIIEGYMRERLNLHYPGWSWERGGLQFLGSEWVVADGELVIPDTRLLGLGIIPPVRKYWAGGAARIQYRKDAPHTAENVVDISNNIKGAVSAAFKKAINSLTGIGDDVYGKRIDEEGMTSDIADLFTGSAADIALFGEFVKSKKLPWSRVFQILGVESLTKVTDFREAYNKIKEVTG